MVSIYFRLQTDTDHRGWRVVGNCPSLGSWNPNHGFRLDVRSDSYWTSAAPVTVPHDVTLEYKYVYWAGDSYCWEALSCNRTLHPTQLRMTVEDTEGHPVSKSHILSFQSYPSRQSPYYFPEPTSPVHLASPEEARVIIVSWKSPLVSNDKQLIRQPEPWIEHLYSALIAAKVNFTWICGQEVTNIDPSQLRSRHIVPVPINTEARTRHQSFVTTFLKPLFQSLVNGLCHFTGNLTELWDGYRTVNSCVADVVMEVYTGEEMVWLHDCELLLTPIFLARRTKEPLNLGLSLHHPISPSEVFKLLPYNAAILNSMLSCDLVEFEAIRYIRHFQRSCESILEANCICREDGAIGLDYCGRFITIDIRQMGVSVELIEEAVNSEVYKETVLSLEKSYKGVNTWVSLDAMQPWSGLLQKISIFKAYLQSSHRPPSRLLQLYFHCNSHSSYFKSVQSAVQSLNTEFKSTVVELIPASDQLELRLAYFTVCSRYFNSAVKEGVSIPILEFILMHEYSPCSIVISEFSVFSTVLQSPAVLNPFGVELSVEVLQHHCNLTPLSVHDIKTAKCQNAHQYCSEYLKSLSQARKNEREYVFASYGLSENAKYVALSRNFASIFDSDVLDRYRKSHNRLILTDNEGTLMDIIQYADLKDYQLSARVVSCLTALSQDPSNSLYVATGRSKQTLDSMFSDIPGLGLVAESGSFIKDHCTLYDWERVAPHSLEWLQPATDIISNYVSRLEGSYIERKETAVKFSYTHIDPDYGYLQAQELIAHLGLVMQPYQDQCEVVAGSDYVEVKAWGVTKGSALLKIKSLIEARRGEVDFILAIGDGISDEEMFRELRKSVSHSIYSCVVGMKPTSARYYLADRSEVMSLLEALTQCNNSGRVHN